MKLRGLSVAALCLAIMVVGCTRASKPQAATPVPTLFDKQFEQVQTVFLRFAPEARQSVQLLRERFVSALTPAHRTAIAQAFGEYAVADRPDDAALTRRVDSILTPRERQGVANAMTVYMAEQDVLGVRAVSELLREHPNIFQGSHSGTNTSSEIATPPRDSASILAHWLPLLGVEEEPAPGESPQLAVFTYSGPNNERLRAHMRASMLAALSRRDRVRAGQVIGASALTPASNNSTLSKQLDKVLSINEQEHIVAAFQKFLQAQAADLSQFPTPKPAVSMAAEFPDLAALARSKARPDAGAVLWRALLLRGSTFSFVTR